MIEKNGVKLTFETDEKLIEYNMDRCASFMARMIRKYGRDVLDKTNSEKKGREEYADDSENT